MQEGVGQYNYQNKAVKTSLIKWGNTLQKVYKLLFLFCILNIVDYSTTMLAISHGAVEGNSIADYFVGNNVLHYYKLVGVGLLCIYLIHTVKRNLKSQLSVIKVLSWANFGFSFIAVSNVVVYFIQKHQN